MESPSVGTETGTVVKGFVPAGPSDMPVLPPLCVSRDLFSGGVEVSSYSIALRPSSPRVKGEEGDSTVKRETHNLSREGKRG